MARFVTDQQLYQELKSPIMWWFQADLRDVALMISGISLEVIFKSKIICDFSWPINEETFARAIIKNGHDLVGLSTKIRMRLDKEHLPFLKELTQYILWMGRYPIPKGSNPSCIRRKAVYVRRDCG